MKNCLLRASAVGCAFVLGGLVASPAAQAASTPFTWASVDTSSLPSGVTGGYIVQTNTVPPSPAQETQSLSGDWGSLSGFASADLSTGQLKVLAAASDTPSGTHPYVNANAFFGDSFTTTTTGGQPFSWTSGTTAQFSLALNGSITSSSKLSDMGARAFIVLALYQKGTLDPSKSLLGANLIGSPYLWTIGNAGGQLYYTDPSGNSSPVIATGNFDTIPSSIKQTITPGGDFDWVLLLGAGGQPGPDQSFNIDLSHTVTLGYQGPTGTTTSSSSGMFTNIASSVPEPQSWALMLLGLAATVSIARRRSSH
jgi:hypothetical protein